MVTNINDIKNHFNKVLEFNKVFGARFFDKNIDMINELIKDPLYSFRMDLIKEETEELKEACKTKNSVEVIDALVDILYVVHGAIGVFNGEPSGIYINDIKYQIYPTSKLLEEYINSIKPYNKKISELININVNTITNGPNNIVDYYTDIISYSVRDLLHYPYINDTIKPKNKYILIYKLNNILFLVYKFLDIINVDANIAFDIVHNSNMSKICKTEKEAIYTVAWYKTTDDPSAKKYDSPAYQFIYNKYYIVYNESTGKVLKNIYYKKADFSALI